MICYYYVLILFFNSFVYANNNITQDEKYVYLDDENIDHNLILPKSNKKSYKRYKELLRIAIDNDDIVNIAGVYYMAKLGYQRYVSGMILGGGLVVVGLGTAFFTFGVTSPYAIAGAAVLSFDAIYVRNYKKIKNHAKEYLRTRINDILWAQIKKQHDLKSLKALLASHGYDVSNMLPHIKTNR